MTARRGRNPAAAVVSHRPWSPSPTRSSRRTPAGCGSIRWSGCAGLPSSGRAPPVAGRAFRLRLPAAALGLLRRHRRRRRALNLGAAPALSGELPARRGCGDASARLRHPAARGAALSHRRPAEPVRDAVPGAGPDLGDGAAARPHAGARLPGGRLGHDPRPRPPAAALVAGRGARRCRSSTSPGSGSRSCSASPSSASMPGASPRRRASSPRRSPRPSWCCRASSTCRSSTGSPPPPRTSSARRSPPSRSSPRSSTTRLPKDGPVARGRHGCCASRSSAAATSSAKLTSLGQDEPAFLDTPDAQPPRRGGRRAAARLSASRSRSRPAASGPEPVGRRNPGRHLRARPTSSTTPSISPRARSASRRAGRPTRSGIEITDDGPGFPPEVLLRVGEPYVTTRGPATRREHEGAAASASASSSPRRCSSAPAPR